MPEAEGAVLLDELEVAIWTYRGLERGSDASLVVLDQLADLVSRLLMVELGVDEKVVREVLRSVGLDRALGSVTSAES
jgi:hypothetical protein